MTMLARYLVTRDGAAFDDLLLASQMCSFIL